MFSIVIPIKNQEKIIKMCLESVLKHYRDQDIIVIDDGSTEQEVIDYLDKLVAANSCTMIRNTASFGHSKACSLGMNQAKHENVFLLNSDTIVTKNSLNILSKVLDDHRDIAVVGPSTSSASGPQLLNNLYPMRFSMTVQEIEDFAILLEKKTEINDIALVNGFCFGVKKSVFNQLRGFDQDFADYGNEKEFLIRVRHQLKLRTVHVTGSYVHHLGKMTYAHENMNIGVAQKQADDKILRKHGTLK